MDPVFERCQALLEQELVPALGCTEPSAVAYTAACAARALGRQAETMEVYCSASVIKNVHSVAVPNAQGRKGVVAAALLGMLVAAPEKSLQILQAVGPEHQARLAALLEAGVGSCQLVENVDTLYIRVQLQAGEDRAEAEVSGSHTHLTRLTRNGQTLAASNIGSRPPADGADLTFEQIWDFAEHCRLERLLPVLRRMVQCNTAISHAGLEHTYGTGVGPALLRRTGRDDIAMRARAAACAGSDARMNGCPLPVVIVSGSGNQGLTCSLPVIEYARILRAPEEKLYRGLILASLVTLRLKAPIGSLSAFCGAVCAAAGAGAGVAYLLGGDLHTVCDTITYTLGTVGGMVCDGAKSSCAAKISTALETTLFAVSLSMEEHRCFAPGDGLIRQSAEATADAYGQMAHQGMQQTNAEILRLMLAADRT